MIHSDTIETDKTISFMILPLESDDQSDRAESELERQETIEGQKQSRERNAGLWILIEKLRGPLNRIAAL